MIVNRLLVASILIHFVATLVAQAAHSANWSSITSENFRGFHFEAIAVNPDEDKIYAAGAIDTTFYFVKCRKGAVWGDIGEPLNGPVRALAVQNGILFIGGDFTGTIDHPGMLNHIARLNPARNEWEQLGPGLDSSVWVFCADADNLYVGGSFRHSNDGAVLNGLARWNGQQYEPLGAGIDVSNGKYAVCALVMIDKDLYLGGSFVRDHSGKSLNRVACWERASNTILPLGNGFLNGIVNTLTFNGSRLVAGGSFNQIDNTAYAGHLAQWDGKQWSNCGNFSGNVCSVISAGSKLFAGGFFTQEGNRLLAHIACFDYRRPNDGWKSLAPGDGGLDAMPTGTGIFALAKQENALFAAGNFEALSQGAQGLYGLALWQDSLCANCLFCDFTPAYTEVHAPDETASCEALVVIPRVMDAPFGLKITDYVKLTAQETGFEESALELTNDSLQLKNLEPGQMYQLRAYAECAFPQTGLKYNSYTSRPVEFGSRLVQVEKIKKTSAELVVGLGGTKNPIKVSAYYRQSGEKEWQQLVSTQPQKLNRFKIKNLKPGTLYEFKAGFTCLKNVMERDRMVEIVEKCVYSFHTAEVP